MLERDVFSGEGIKNWIAVFSLGDGKEYVNWMYKGLGNSADELRGYRKVAPGKFEFEKGEFIEK